MLDRLLLGTRAIMRISFHRVARHPQVGRGLCTPSRIPASPCLLSCGDRYKPSLTCNGGRRLGQGCGRKADRTPSFLSALPLFYTVTGKPGTGGSTRRCAEWRVSAGFDTLRRADIHDSPPATPY